MTPYCKNPNITTRGRLQPGDVFVYLELPAKFTTADYPDTTAERMVSYGSARLDSYHNEDGLALSPCPGMVLAVECVDMPVLVLRRAS